MATATATAPNTLTYTNSYTLVRNLLRASFAIICHNRGFCDPIDFEKKPIVLAGVNIPHFIGRSKKARKLVSWLEKGVFDALDKKYLKEVVFGLKRTPSSKVLIESYHFTFAYGAEGVEVKFNGGNRSGGKYGIARTPEEVSTQVTEMLTNVLQTVASLRPIQEKCYMWMQLDYYPHVPPDYQPPCFQSVEADDDNDELEYDGPPTVVPFGCVNSGFHSVEAKLVAPKNAFLTTPVTEKGSVTDKPRKPELNVSNAQKVPTPLAPKQRFSKNKQPQPGKNSPDKEQPEWMSTYNAICSELKKSSQQLPLVMSVSQFISRFKVPRNIADDVYNRLVQNKLIAASMTSVPQPRQEISRKRRSITDEGASDTMDVEDVSDVPLNNNPKRPRYTVNESSDDDDDRDNVVAEALAANSQDYRDSNSLDLFTEPVQQHNEEDSMDVDDTQAPLGSDASGASNNTSESGVSQKDVEVDLMALQQYIKVLEYAAEGSREYIKVSDIRDNLKLGSLANAIIKKMEEDRCIDKKVTRNGKKINKQVVIQKLRELKNKLSLARGKLDSRKAK